MLPLVLAEDDGSVDGLTTGVPGLEAQGTDATPYNSVRDDGHAGKLHNEGGNARRGAASRTALLSL